MPRQPSGANALRAMANFASVSSSLSRGNALNMEILKARLASISSGSRTPLSMRDVPNETKARGIRRTIHPTSRNVQATIATLRRSRDIAKKEERRGHHDLPDGSRMEFSTTIGRLKIHKMLLGYHMYVFYNECSPGSWWCTLATTPLPNNRSNSHPNPFAWFTGMSLYVQDGATIDQLKALRIALISCIEFTKSVPTWDPLTVRDPVARIVVEDLAH